MARTKRVSFDGDDDNDRCNRSTMSKRRQRVEAQQVDPFGATRASGVYRAC